jgi:cardiolipin synthase
LTGHGRAGGAVPPAGPAAAAPAGGPETAPALAGAVMSPAEGDAATGAPLMAAVAGDGADPSLSRVLTVPNLVTALRLACVPVFVWLLFGAHRQTVAAVLLGVLGATDWVDGFVARRWHQVSTLGKVLDPLADRVLVLTGVLSVIVVGAVPVWFGAATVAREAMVSAAVLLLAALGAERIDVLWVGKAGTFGLMFAYPTFLLAQGTSSWQHPFEIVAWVCAVPGLALAWIAAAAYLPRSRQALARGRGGRSAARRAPSAGGGGATGPPGGTGEGGVSSA